jgi:hypothetical protein
MKYTSIPGAMLVLALLSPCLRAQESAPPVVTAAEALTLGAEGIAAKRGDESEAGLGFASLFYAAARRLETENALAAKDITLVVDLGRYREAVAAWDLAWGDAMYAFSGGGSMWVHLSSHREASREEMLAKLAQRMPLKSGAATSETLARWAKIGQAIDDANLSADADPELKAGWEQQKQSLHSLWERLDFELQALENTDALLVMEHIMPDEEQIQMLSGNE